jgi:hypothetical protein
MPIRVVDICPKCGRRNESPDMTPEMLILIARLQELVLAGIGNPLCADCQGVEKRPSMAEGEARAKRNAAS